MIEIFHSYIPKSIDMNVIFSSNFLFHVLKKKLEIEVEKEKKTLYIFEKYLEFMNLLLEQVKKQNKQAKNYFPLG